MATFIGEVGKAKVETVKEVDAKTGVVTTYPELRCSFASASCDVDEMRQLLADMMGKPVKVSVVLEQLELDA
jgi:hypothetical protein